MAGVDQRGRDLAEEAIWLTRVLLQLVPKEAEVRGLRLSMLHCEARRPARRAPDGRCVPVSEQDARQWSLPLIEEAEHHLLEASRHSRSGRFQLKAAIQSVHAERARTGRTAWIAIMPFYGQLIRISPTLGTRTGYAAAVGSERTGSSASRTRQHRSQGCIRLSTLLGRSRSAPAGWEGHPRQRTLTTAIGLTGDPAVKEFLLQRRG
jgi:RNA polymerase sigma-70 factor, ECF subfamily